MRYLLLILALMFCTSCKDEQERQAYIQKQIEFCLGWTKHCEKEYGGHHFVHNWGKNGDCANCPINYREWQHYGPAVMKRLREGTK